MRNIPPLIDRLCLLLEEPFLVGVKARASAPEIT
jgi:hypothetical protein